jgi:hypothetical protein
MSSLTPSSGFVCSDCGSSYTTSRHLDAHECQWCAGSKRGISKLLGQAKDLWEARKRRRLERKEAPPQEQEQGQGQQVQELEPLAPDQLDFPPHLSPTSTIPLPVRVGVNRGIFALIFSVKQAHSVDSLAQVHILDDQRPLSLRKSSRKRKVPDRYTCHAAADSEWDEEAKLPEPLPPMGAINLCMSPFCL